MAEQPGNKNVFKPSIFIIALVVVNCIFLAPVSASPAFTMVGADVSSLQHGLDLGAKYYYANGASGDPLQILKDNGINYIRLRIWNNPQNGYNNLSKVLIFAQTVKSYGFKLMIDFHYSDTWADTTHQIKPAAWANHNINQLQTDVYNYTYDVCTALKNQGTAPDSVEIGNEINTGMLWPEGEVINGDFTNLSLLLKSGYNAIKTCNPETQVVIHTAYSDSDANARWFYDGIKSQGVSWDITGLSYYCYWQGTSSNMSSVVKDLKARYEKPVSIVETAYSFTSANADSQVNDITSPTPCSGYPATLNGQYQNLKNTWAAASAGGAAGIFYWEPTWIATAGNGWAPTNPSSGDLWDNQTLFNWQGVATPAMAVFKP